MGRFVISHEIVNIFVQFTLHTNLTYTLDRNLPTAVSTMIQLNFISRIYFYWNHGIHGDLHTYIILLSSHLEINTFSV